MECLPFSYRYHRRALFVKPRGWLVCVLVLVLSVRSTYTDKGRVRSTANPIGRYVDNNRTVSRCAEFDEGIGEGELTVAQRYEDIGLFTRGPGCGDKPLICPRCAGPTCCTADVELRLMARSRLEFDAIVVKKINAHRQTLITTTNKFEAFCVQLMDKSKRNLYDMFTKTYGQLFQKNSEIFIQLYRDLTGFYKGQIDHDLVDTIDRFFSALFQRMFEMLNSQYTFSEQYFSCVTEHMSLLKPFGDVPVKLSAQIKRSFTAARTFVQGLAYGRDVINSMTKQELSSHCHNQIVRMLHCRHCSGVITDVSKPCHGYCTDVSKECLAVHAQLNEVWNTYLDELLKLSQRLAGPFNMERVVDPLDVTISDAIMNYQENSASISELVFQGCGQPEYSKHAIFKREASNQSTTSNPESLSKVRPRSGASSLEFERLLREARHRLQPLSDMWEELSVDVCQELATNISSNFSGCWNGRRRSVYGRSGDSLVKKTADTTLEQDVQKRSSLVDVSTIRLNVIIGRLRLAYLGSSVDWSDTVDDDESGSGLFDSSGSELDGPHVKISLSEDISFTTDRPTIRPIIVATRPQHTFSNRSERTTIHTLFIYFFCITTFILKTR